MAQAALRSYPALRRDAPALGARRRRAEDPPRDPAQARGVRRRAGFERRGVEIHVGTTLESYDGSEAVLANGMRIPARTLVWTAGVRASPLLPRSRPPARRARSRHRRRDAARRRVRRHLGARRLHRGAEREDAGRRRPTDVPARAPPGAAAREEPHGRAPKPYGYRMLGQVATLGTLQGHRRDPGPPPLGLPGWFVTRTYHLYQLPLLSRKLRVVVDWTVALFFRRDIVELSMLGHAEKLGE